MKSPDLAQLFSGEDFRWQMRFERGELRSFFKPAHQANAILAERIRWIAATPEKYAVLLPEAVPLLDETIQIAVEYAALEEQQVRVLRRIPNAELRCRALGGMWEADFALLGPAPSGQLLLLGGVVCFPSSWSLPEKIGKPMQAIHSPVPQLNEAIGRQIDLFLSKLRPGVVWLRSNWGIVRSPELNQHPDRNLPRLTTPIHLGTTFLRIERQALVALPRNNGVLFGIKVEQVPLSDLKKDGNATASLIHGLRTMSEEIANYKGIGGVKREIIELLGSVPTNVTNSPESGN